MPQTRGSAFGRGDERGGASRSNSKTLNPQSYKPKTFFFASGPRRTSEEGGSSQADRSPEGGSSEAGRSREGGSPEEGRSGATGGVGHGDRGGVHGPEGGGDVPHLAPRKASRGEEQAEEWLRTLHSSKPHEMREV